MEVGKGLLWRNAELHCAKLQARMPDVQASFRHTVPSFPDATREAIIFSEAS
jgi:hypothetical protein